MIYHHEFTIDASELVDMTIYEDSKFVLSFDMGLDGDIEDFDLLRIDGDNVTELDIAFIEECEGYGAFWGRVEDACEAEKQSLTEGWADRKSTRLNSSHVAISYAVFCLK